jgi:alpha-L-rhamnosidase
VTLAADGDATLFVNGDWVGSGAGWAKATRLELPALAAGELVLSVTVGHHGGIRAPTALAARFEARCVDGQAIALATDARWQAADWVLPDWKKPGFDATNWQAARVYDAGAAARWGQVPVAAVGDGPAVWLRREFTLETPVRRAVAYLSGLGWSELWINGTRAGDEVLSPGLTDYARRVQVVARDITALLRSGPNAAGIVLGNGRFRAPRPNARDYGMPRALLQIEITLADGTTRRVVSDTAWRATDAGPIRANNEYDGEDYDARAEMPGWSAPGFDVAAWQPAVKATPPAGRLVSAMAEPSRVLQVRAAKTVTRDADGRVIFDFGQNMAGVCRLSLDAPPGTAITLRHAERLGPDGRLDVANLRSARATDTYVARGGAATWQPRFTTHGFRYAELTGVPAGTRMATLAACVVGDDLAPSGHFACSNALLTRIHEAIAWTVRSNCRSIRTDCPQRDERQGWLGDPAEEARGEAYLFGNAAFYAKWLHDIADAQREDGSLPDVAPPYWAVDPDDVSWPAALVAITDMLREHHGDTRIVRTMLPVALRWLDHLLGRVKDGTIDADQYGDWGAPPEDRRLTHPADPARLTSGSLIATAYLVHCLEMVGAWAAQDGRAEDAMRLRMAARDGRAGFHARFLNAGAGWYDNGTATACILPLAFGLVPAERREAVIARLVHQIDQADGPQPAFGLVGAQFACRVLTEIGRADLAYGMATRSAYPSLGYMLAQGATTLWELWNGDTAPAAMNSGNHTMLMGDLPLWLYRHVLGLVPDAPGFAAVRLAPNVVGDLTWAAGATETPVGRLGCEWRLTGDRLRVVAEVPANVSARFVAPPGFAAPALAGGSVLGGGRHVIDLVRATGKGEEQSWRSERR